MASLPAGSLRTELLRLRPAARDRALTQLLRAQVPREDFSSLHVTRSGQLYYACHFGPPPRTAAGEAASHESSVYATADAGAAVPIGNPPARHSKPGSAAVLYLDFNGHRITGTGWNTEAEPTLQALPYDTDGQAATFSAAEQAAIVEIWERVAEDYAPFDVDVTTEEPALFTSTTGRAVITRSKDENNLPMPSGDEGGVAFLDSFGWPDYVTAWSPAFVYYDNLGSPDDIAEAVSHELGHNVGLSHDGQSGSEYYTGHGSGETSWGAIMGGGYGRNVTQWSKGEYYLANNPEDDLAIISGHLGYRTDVAGATPATATSLTASGNRISASGVLAPAARAAVYSFNTAAGKLTFAATAYRAASGPRGGNADLKLELLNAAGKAVAVADPAANPDATLTYDAPAGGIYYVRLTPAGTGTPMAATPTGYTSYGSVGQYILTGSIVAAKPAITSALSAKIGGAQLFSYAIKATNSPTQFSATPLPVGLTVNASTGVISGRPLRTGTFKISLGATNGLGTGVATLTLTVSAAAPAIVHLSNPRNVVASGGAFTLSATAASSNGSPTYQWFCNGRPIAGATATSLALKNLKPAASGYYQVSVKNTVGVTTSATVFLIVAPPKTQVVVWGNNSDGQALVPVGLVDAVAVASGYAHTVALRRGGIVTGWGANGVGQATSPVQLKEAVAVAAGNFHSLALRSDGTVFAWGNSDGVPSGLSGVVAIAAGYSHSLALKNGGTVVAWGSNAAGQTKIPAGLKNVVAIAAGDSHSLALKADGTVVAWGANDRKQCSVPAGLKAVAISAGYGFSVAQKSDGSIVGWGDNGFNQLKPPSGAPPLSAVAAGGYHAIGLKSDGTVIAWGYNGKGQASVPTGLKNVFVVGGGFYNSAAVRGATGDAVPKISVQPTPKAVLETAKVTLSVTASGGAAVLQYQWRRDGAPIAGANAAAFTIAAAVLADAGSYDVVVSNELGSVTSKVAKLVVNKLPVITSLSKSRQTYAEGSSLSLSAKAAGSGTLKYQWYRNGKPIAGATKSTYARAAATAADAGYYWVGVTDSAGTRRSSALFALYAPSATSVKGWGANTSGRLTIPASLNDAIALAAGKNHVLALRAGGTVVGWGENTYKQRALPAGLSGIVGIAAGERHSLALKADGTVVAWGDNTYGQTAVPSGLKDVVAVQARWYRSYALKADGTVIGWGSGADDQTAKASPTGVVTLAAGDYHILAATAAGKVIAWGDDSLGDTKVPAGLTGVSAVAGGGNHSLALKSSGLVVAWGYNGNGQCTVPTGLTGVIAVAAGSNHSVALKANGTLVAWGSRAAGQSTVPAGLDRVFAIAAVDNYTLALRNVAKASVKSMMTQKVDEPETSRSQWAPSAPSSIAMSPSSAKPVRGGDNARVLAMPVSTKENGAEVITDVRPSATAIVLGDRLVRTNADLIWSISLPGSAAGCAWFKDGVPIAGATQPVLTLRRVQSSEAGEYRVVVTAASGEAKTGVARLIVVDVTSARTETKDGRSTLTQTLTLAGGAETLSFSLLLPPSWSYAGASGPQPDERPAAGDTELLEWTWTDPPVRPWTFTYRLTGPADAGLLGKLEGLIRVSERDGAQALPVEIPLPVR